MREQIVLRILLLILFALMVRDRHNLSYWLEGLHALKKIAWVLVVTMFFGFAVAVAFIPIIRDWVNWIFVVTG